MSQGMTLYGSEDVSRAGYNMQSAAQDMLRASNSIEESTRRLEMLFGQGYGSNIDRLIDALAPKPAESERNTALLTDLHPLISVLTSDAANDMHPMLKMAVRGFLKLHPELEP